MQNRLGSQTAKFDPQHKTYTLALSIYIFLFNFLNITFLLHKSAIPFVRNKTNFPFTKISEQCVNLKRLKPIAYMCRAAKTFETKEAVHCFR